MELTSERSRHGHSLASLQQLHNDRVAQLNSVKDRLVRQKEWLSKDLSESLRLVAGEADARALTVAALKSDLVVTQVSHVAHINF